ncbi:MAG: hypothetical protein RXO25_03660 [Caldivirga sp.]
MIRLTASLIILLATLPILAATPNYVVNYGLLYINGSSTLISLPVNGSLIIPLRCMGNVANVTLVVDPRSQMGVSSALLILNNGSVRQVTGLNSPKLINTWVNCRDTYGLVVNVANYMKIPPVLYLYNGPPLTGSFSGSGLLVINNTSPPGLTTLYSIIELMVISGSVNPSSPFTFLVNSSKYVMDVNGVSVVINRYIYVSYTAPITFKVTNATVYYSVNVTYSIPITGMSWNGLALLSNDTLYYVVHLQGSMSRLGNAMPVFIPGEVLVRVSGLVNWAESQVSLKVNPWCSNYLTPAQVVNGSIVAQVPSNVTLYIGDEPVANLVILGLASGGASISLNNVIMGSSLRVTTLDNYPINATVLLIGHGIYTLLRNNTCLTPGIYSIIVMSNVGYYRLTAVVNQSLTTITIPVFHVVNLNVTLTQLPPACSGVSLLLNSSTISINRYGDVFNVTLGDVKYGSRIMANAVVNGSVVGSMIIRVNSSTLNVAIPIRAVSVKVTGLLNSPINAIVNIGGLRFHVNGSALVCAPVDANYATLYTLVGSFTAPIVNNSISVSVPYYINLNYLIAILLVVTVLSLAVLIARFIGKGRDGGGGGDVVIVVGD